METNKHGNSIERSFIGGNRYIFDFKILTSKKGWIQYDTDQDASYFGVWVNPGKMQIVTFAEGDFTLTKCKDKASFEAELKEMAEFYGSPPPSAIAIDPGTGKVTKYYDKSGFFGRKVEGLE